MAVAGERYSPRVIDHFDHPRNAGRFEPAANVIEAQAGRSDQAVVFHLSARVNGATIEAVRFTALGCPHCIAAASWLTQVLQGMTADDLARWNWRTVAQALDVPAEKHGRLLLLEDSVRRLAEALRARG